MATLPITLESTRTLTPREFATWVVHQEQLGDPNHYELLSGKVIMNPPAGYPHGRIENRIEVLVTNYVDAHHLGLVFGSSQGFELPSGDTLEPDASFVSHARWKAAPTPEEGKFLRVVPDLVVEIASPSTEVRDRTAKKAAYEQAGVREYWIVAFRSRTIVQLVRKGRKLTSERVCKVQLVSHVLRGLVVDVPSVFP